jgi:hypothetical protein
MMILGHSYHVHTPSIDMVIEIEKSYCHRHVRDVSRQGTLVALTQDRPNKDRCDESMVPERDSSSVSYILQCSAILMRFQHS